MKESCPGCMRLENLVLKLKRENTSLRAKVKETPTQAINNLRAEVQELRSIVERKTK